MNKGLIIKGLLLSFVSSFLLSSSVFANINTCIGPGTDKSNLVFTTSPITPREYPVKCVRYKDGDTWGTIYGRSSSDCAEAGAIISDPTICDAIAQNIESEEKEENFNNSLPTIINISLLSIMTLLILISVALLAAINKKLGKIDKNNTNI